MSNSPRNVAASIHQRLLDKARKSNRPFNEMLQYLAMERFLYRLSESRYAGDFILKGALMLPVWKVAVQRPTMDIDLLGSTSNDLESIQGIVREICLQPVDDDGFAFEPNTVSAARITEDAEYEGVRVRFQGRLGNARITLQIDIGFGDAVFPAPQGIEFPSILGLATPRIQGYTRESSIAEKCSAMLVLGELNSRVKDFFDIWVLSRQFDFDGDTMRTALGDVLSKRGIAVSPSPVAFSEAYSSDPGKDRQWKGFLRKSQLASAPGDFREVVSSVGEFLTPVLKAIVSETPFHYTWKAPGPWLPIHPK